MTRRAFWYHLKFELYNSPHPDRPDDIKKRKEFWLPEQGADIFGTSGSWPEHTTSAKDAESGKSAWQRSLDNSSEQSLELLQSGKQQLEQGNKQGIEGQLIRGRNLGKLIDCGPDRPSARSTDRTGSESTRDYGTIHKGGLKDKNIHIRPETFERTAVLAARDWRFGSVRIEGLDLDLEEDKERQIYNKQDMSGSGDSSVTGETSGKGRGVTPEINSGPRSQATKARFEDVGAGKGLKNTRVGWGIVHLYRDSEETPRLGYTARETSTTVVSSSSASQLKGLGSSVDERDDPEGDTTILCIPAVPSYMTPSDFLGWVGEKTREEVSHFRMVMTGQMNRYLVLLKFRDPAVARRWRDEWDGRVFGGLEPENCHVMFIKSIVFETPSKDATGSFPYMTLDPFTPSLGAAAESTSLALKPFPPPTPSLVELPTCPVCLERMDDTTGLLTILCQHVFHCACLTKWRGSGCPVCRHTQPSPSLNQPFGTTASDLCRVCDCPDDLWICLICGNVGCGRYKGGHAKEHWKETAHNYALEIETQHVWDYAGDLWVHRLIRDKGDGKLVELPESSRSNGNAGLGGHREDREDVEMVPRAKLDQIGMEYTQMLTSQLDSQRVYFEEVVKKAVDKASSASKAAETASAQASAALSQLEDLKLEHLKLRDEIVPALEKERDRLSSKADKSAELARTMTNRYQEEKKVGEGLMSRVAHLTEMVGKMRAEVGELKRDNAELKEENRDLGFFISSQDKLKEVGGELGEEIKEGVVRVPEPPPKGKGRGRKK